MEKSLCVIVPVYNVENYLKECVNSIINQTYSNLEIVLVDDGSTDSSGQLCDEFAAIDSRIKVIHQKNMGMIMARYNGIRTTECEYITFVDSDDWICLDTYETISKYMDNGYDVIAYGITKYFDKNNQSCYLDDIDEGEYYKQDIIKNVYPKMIWNIEKQRFGFTPSLCNKIMKRDCIISALEKVKDLKCNYGEDSATLYPMMLNINTLAVVKTPCYYHRMRNSGDVQQYITDTDFFIKTYKLYEYMKSEFSDDKNLLKQLDYFYIYSVGLKRRVYKDFSQDGNYMFPFKKVEKNTCVVLYGAKIVGQTFYKQIIKSDYCKLVLWVDKNYKNFNNPEIQSVENIYKINYDYIVIAIASEAVALKVKEELIGRGIEEKKIII